MVQCVPGDEGVSSSEGGGIQLKYRGDVIAIRDRHDGEHDLLAGRSQTCSQSFMLRVQLEERGDLVTMETQHLHRFTDYVTKIKAVFSEETIFDSWHVYKFACDMKFNKAFESMTKKHLSISLMVRYMWVPAKQVWQFLVNNKVNWFLIHFRETRGKFSLRFYKPDLRVSYQQTKVQSLAHAH